MSTTPTPAPSSRRRYWIAVGAIALLAAAAAATWALRPEPTASAEPTPTPSLTLRAVDPSGAQHPAAPDTTASAEPTVEPEPAAEEGGGILAGLDDAAGQQAYDAGTAAVLAVVSQPVDETTEQRSARLTPLFVAGSPTPSAGAPIDLEGIGLTSLGRVDAAGVVWAEPFDPGDGRIGFLVAVNAQTFGVRGDGEEQIAWKDVSTQVWRVLLTGESGTWTPQVAYLADQDEPNGES